MHSRVIAGDLDVAVVTDAPPGLPNDPQVERRLLTVDEMMVVLPVDHPQAGRGPVHIRALADELWAEDNDGSAALLRRHTTRAGVSARIDLAAADLHGKLALVATGHAIALIPGVLRYALRADVTAVPLVDPPTRGAFTPSHHGTTPTPPRPPCSISSRRPAPRHGPPTPSTGRRRPVPGAPRGHGTAV